MGRGSLGLMAWTPAALRGPHSGRWNLYKAPAPRGSHLGRLSDRGWGVSGDRGHEVFRDALLHGSGAIVIAHNHPSGDAEPSRDDERITRRFGQAGEILGVEVLDHLVIGHQRWVSLARRGALINRSPVADFHESRSESVAVDHTMRR